MVSDVPGSCGLVSSRDADPGVVEPWTKMDYSNDIFFYKSAVVLRKFQVEIRQNIYLRLSVC